MYAAGACHHPQREERRRHDADGNGVDEVDADRHDRRQDEDGGRRAVGAQDDPHRPERNHLHRCHHQDAGQSGQRDHRHRGAREVDDGDQQHRMDDRSPPGAPAGADVDGGAGDGPGGRHPTEEAGGDGREPLAD